MEPPKSGPSQPSEPARAASAGDFLKGSGRGAGTPLPHRLSGVSPGWPLCFNADAVSIPDEVFEDAERLVEQLHTSRSQLYSRALAEFVARHSEDHVTDTMNKVVDEVGTRADDFTRKAAHRVLRRAEW